LRKILVLALAGLTVAAVALAGIAAATSHGSGKGVASVRALAVHPNGNTGCISIEIEIRGWVMYPGRVGQSAIDTDGGHYHVYVNGKYHNFGSNANRARACGLASGASYQLQVVLARNDHSQLNARTKVISAILG
jgi:hypothetical protein